MAEEFLLLIHFREDDCPMFYTLEGSDEELVYNSTFDNSTIGVGFEESNTTE